MRLTARGINNLFIASLCWRYKTGQALFRSSYVQRQIYGSFNVDVACQPMSSPVEVVARTRSAYLANQLRSMLTNNDFRMKFYELVLKHNMSKVYRDEQRCTVGTDLEREYVEGWLNAILEDAIATGIQNISEVNWSTGLRSCLGKETELVV